MISVTNRWGAAQVAFPPKVHIDDLPTPSVPATTPTTPIAKPTAKPKALELADPRLRRRHEALRRDA